MAKLESGNAERSAAMWWGEWIQEDETDVYKAVRRNKKHAS